MVKKERGEVGEGGGGGGGEGKKKKGGKWPKKTFANNIIFFSLYSITHYSLYNNIEAYIRS